jgi:hypothetical protein
MWTQSSIQLRILLITISLGLSACRVTSLDPWANYPSQFTGTQSRFSRWLVVKCAYNNDPLSRFLPLNLPPEYTDLDTYIDYFFTLRGANTGNLVDWLHDVTYGRLEFQPRVVGWYTAPFNVGTTLNRKERVEQCANAITDADAAELNFEDYDGVIALTNTLQDGGACYTGKANMNIKGRTYSLGCLTFDSNSLYTAFASHELGQGLGLVHSADESLVDYTDRFDIMSALNTVRFEWPNYPGTGAAEGFMAAGPGMSAPNLLQLDAVPADRLAHWTVGDWQLRFILTALSHPEDDGALVLRIEVPQGGATPRVFTVEYRVSDGWDEGFPQDVVLVHEYRQGAVPSSVLKLTDNGTGYTLRPPNVFTQVNLPFEVRVDELDPIGHQATVTVLNR